MALSQQHRRTIHQKLSPIIGDEEADALLAHFPTGPADEPVTRAHFDATIAELRAELHDLGRQIVMWSTGTVIAGMGLAAAIGAAVGG